MQTIKLLSILFGILFIANCSDDCTSTNNKSIKGSCCVHDTVTVHKKIVMQSEITCPKCGHKKMETMPTDVCLIRYNCKKCSTEMRPKEGDCCVFCTYGTHKCPSMQ